jgi:hypothetical protein
VQHRRWTDRTSTGRTGREQHPQDASVATERGEMERSEPTRVECDGGSTCGQVAPHGRPIAVAGGRVEVGLGHEGPRAAFVATFADPS